MYLRGSPKAVTVRVWGWRLRALLQIAEAGRLPLIRAQQSHRVSVRVGRECCGAGSVRGQDLELGVDACLFRSNQEHGRWELHHHVVAQDVE